MAIFTSDVSGLEDLLKAFKKLPDEAVVYLEKAANTSANIIHKKAVAKVPVGKRDTKYHTGQFEKYNHEAGNLKKNIKMGKVSRRRKNKYYLYSRVYIGHGSLKTSGAAYGTPLELGHKLVLFGNKTGKHVQERPFLRPAADESKDEVINLYTDALNRALIDFGKKG